MSARFVRLFTYELVRQMKSHSVTVLTVGAKEWREISIAGLSSGHVLVYFKLLTGVLTIKLMSDKATSAAARTVGSPGLS